METKNQDLLERLNEWLKKSITVKLLSVGFLILVLLIPLSMIQSLIIERQSTNSEVIEEVSKTWGDSQTITGPILTLPYYVYYEEQGEVHKHKEYAHFLPETVKINGNIVPEKRERSIYDVMVYNFNLSLSGTFSFPDTEKLNISSGDILWKESTLSIGITDLKGIQETVDLEWNNSQFNFSPGLENLTVINSGMNIKHFLINPESSEQTYSFSINLDLNGSKSLNFIPSGKINDIFINSTWRSPGFTGAFIPDTYSVTSDGFNAHWKVLSMNRNYPQQWTESAVHFDSSAFGVELIIPVDEYQKNMRAAKYGLMIIVLTFTLFFFIEILNKKRIHPIQYIIVGLALTLFYVLLLSLSEHVSFNSAFLVSTLGILTMIIAYTTTIYRNRKLTITTGLSLLAMYAFIFITIQLQDYALLFGSIGLFIILAMVMWISKRIDWYKSEDLRLTEHKQ